MASDPLFTLGARRTQEILTEALVPMGACIGSWKLARRILAEPSVGRGLSTLELTLLLSAFVVVFAWYAGRQLVLLNQRDPLRITVVGTAVALGFVFWLGNSVRMGFDNGCRERGGSPENPSVLAGQSTRVCRVGGLPGNPYLPGTLLRAPWNGEIPVPLWILLAGLGATTVLGTRDRRLRPTRMGLQLAELLRLQPTAGSACVSGGDGSAGLQACANPTLWGELCAQLYPADREMETGEWCVRCSQVYRRCDRELTFEVVGLLTADVDVLNGLERLDALAWDPGDPMPPDARLSGQERWARFGTLTVPDVITVAQLLAIVHEHLGGWSNDTSEEVGEALALHTRRASRLSAWIWIGSVADRLTYARPTDRALLALGPSRLRDLMLEAGETLTLQLDIGLMPVELRSAFRKTFLDPERPPIGQNTKQDLWVPVAPDTSSLEGAWVPRIEGTAMRRWLSLERARDPDIRGVSTPLPYVLPGGDLADPSRVGTLDLIRSPVDPRTHEPILQVRPGDSLAEWSWMEQRQIELLRQHSLVMVAR